ncbi:MAG: deoxyribodipyrimidine photolyase-related protein, partial [Planctomycetota bacterium]
MEVAIIFPHQLFTDAPMLEKVSEVVLIEETLFFNQFNFHKQKLAFHRATMKWMEHFLSEKGYQVTYISAQEAESDIRECITSLAKKGLTTLHFMDPV